MILIIFCVCVCLSLREDDIKTTIYWLNLSLCERLLVYLVVSSNFTEQLSISQTSFGSVMKYYPENVSGNSVFHNFAKLSV